MEEYHDAGVPFYIIVDRKRPEGPPTILAYQRTPRCWIPLPVDDQGRVWLESLGIWIGTRDNRVVCYDGATDQELGDYTAISQALVAANQMVSEQAQVIQELDVQLAEERARADGEKVRADGEKARADAEMVRADQAAQRAEQETQARLAVEARLRELEARLQQTSEPG
jgi:hypothetical protein